MAVSDAYSDLPDHGAVFTFGKCKFNGNRPGRFWLKDERVEDVACGDEHTALISEHGKLYTFGDNSWGQLGLGHAELVDKPTKVKKFNDVPVLSAACGKSHTLILTAVQSIFGFGCNVDGQVDPSDLESTKITDPIEVEITKQTIKMLSAGADHSAALTEPGEVFVWGSCGYLKLISEMPARLPLQETIKLISCGYYHTALLTDDGKVLCYGETEGGKLGVGSIDEEFVGPTKIEAAREKVALVSAGHSHTFLATESGKIMSFGDGFQGQLGQGTMVMSCNEPQTISSEQKIIQITCGESHTAIITEGKKLLICGDGRHGKLCFDNLSNHFTLSSPKVFLNFDVLKVACGGCHTIVLARPKGKYDEICSNRDEENQSKSPSREGDPEYIPDSLARSRRRNKKQDGKVSSENMLKAKQLQSEFSSNEADNSSSLKREIKSTKNEPENMKLEHDSDLKPAEEVLDAEEKERQAEDLIEVNERNAAKKKKQRGPKNSKTKPGPQTADNKNNSADKSSESEELSQKANDKINKKTQNKSNERRDIPENNTPESDHQNLAETQKTAKKSRFCLIL